MQRYRSTKSTTSSAPSNSDESPKPNGSAGDPLGAMPITPELANVIEALAAFSTDPAQLGETKWTQIGEAVWHATGGSVEGFTLFNEWSSKWHYHDDDDARRRWETCGILKSEMDAETLSNMAAKERERKRALEEAVRLDDISFAAQKADLKMKAGLKGDVLEKERTRRPSILSRHRRQSRLR